MSFTSQPFKTEGHVISSFFLKIDDRLHERSCSVSNQRHWLGLGTKEEIQTGKLMTQYYKIEHGRF